MKKRFWMRGAIGAGAFLLGVVTTSFATGSAPGWMGVVDPGETVLGMTYGDWSAAWWQWALSLPADRNPLLDNDGDLCGERQSSTPVFYLAGAFEDEVPETPMVSEVTRTCTVPAGRYLFFPVLNVTADDTDPKGDFFEPTEGGQRNTAASFADLIDLSSLEVTVDGKRIKNLEKFRVQSPAFPFTLPPNNLLGIKLDEYQTFSAVSDGYWIMLEPLGPGTHHVDFKGQFVFPDDSTFGVDVKYELLVK